MLVFISHSRQNSSTALRLCDALRAHGVQTWLDVRDLPPGADWKAKVAEVIRSADALIFVIGPPGASDPGQSYEWQQIAEEELFLDPNRPLIPIVIGGAELPGFLNVRQTIEADESAMDIEAIAGRVLFSLEHPSETVDQAKLQKGIEAREQAIRSLGEYARSLKEQDVKRAGLRALK